jgi:D-alanyl-lipoteichoic acid acyltransferase DltB (MBOAT superfamily)
VIADRLVLLVGPAFDDPSQYNGLTLLIATFFFTFQIYCDFSAYSDIAIGAARVMGFTLMENFRTPYIAQSISEFWRRWHISLSTWFRDYLYIPLGGNRKGEFRRNLNQLLVFLASGLWHGPNWTYVIWGGLHGFYQVAAGQRDKHLPWFRLSVDPNASLARRLPRMVLHTLCTFGLVMLTWVFFRARSVGDALLIFRKIGGLSFHEPVMTAMNAVEIWLSVCLIVFLLIKEHFYLNIPTRNTTRFYVLMTLILFVTYLFGVFTSNQFIYFQF